MADTITLTGTLEQSDGTPARGYLIFQLTAPIVDAGNNLVASRARVRVNLDSNGAFSIDLVPTDDPTYEPENVTYEVTEYMDSDKAPRRTYNIAVPYDAAGGTVDLSDLIPAEAPEEITYAVVQGVTQVDLDAHTTDTINPHETTLELARTQNQQMDGAFDLSHESTPGTPGADILRVYADEHRGHSSLLAINGAGITLDLLTDTVIRLYNSTGATITKGQAVYTSGSQGQRPIAGLAQADSVDTMPASGIAAHDVADNEWGIFYVTALEEDIDTSAWAEGTRLFVSPDTAGALTDTEPTHPDIPQPVGVVENQHASQGSIALNLPPHLAGHESGTNEGTFAIGAAGSSALVLISPDGTRWQITVDNAGNLSTAAV